MNISSFLYSLRTVLVANQSITFMTALFPVSLGATAKVFPVSVTAWLATSLTCSVIFFSSACSSMSLAIAVYLVPAQRLGRHSILRDYREEMTQSWTIIITLSTATLITVSYTIRRGTNMASSTVTAVRLPNGPFPCILRFPTTGARHLSFCHYDRRSLFCEVAVLCYFAQCGHSWRFDWK